VLANNNLIGLSTFAVNLLVALAIAASTDYVIFWVGRYQESRSRGLDVKRPTTTCSAHRACDRGIGPDRGRRDGVPEFCRLPYFQTLGEHARLVCWLCGGLTDAGPGVGCRGQPVRLARPKRAHRDGAGAASPPRWCAGPPRCWPLPRR